MIRSMGGKYGIPIALACLACWAYAVASEAAGYTQPAFWRSALYPTDWTPAFEDSEGRFLHDVSYAGYHNGEVRLPENPPGTVFDAVADFGADNHGQADATSAVQQALNAAAAAGGGIVFLPAGLYRCDGQLTVQHSGIVLRGAGETETRVYFTKVTGMAGQSHIGIAGSVTQGPDLPLAVDGVNRSFVVYLNDASSLQPGDDISIGWVITNAFVAEHGMTGTWQAFNGTWQPVFRRKVVAVNTAVSPHEVRLDVPSRYPAKVRDSASVRKETGYLQECGIERLSIANAVDFDAAWTQIGVHAIHFQGVKDCWVRNLRSFISPADPSGEYHLQGGGIRITASKRLTVADSRLDKAQNRGDGGCGYLFHTTTSNEVLFRDCVGNAGRHNFIVNWDFGSTGCVFLRCKSSNGREFTGPHEPSFVTGFCEYHHSLAMACLVDQCEINDGWSGGNREGWSSGAGHTVTQSAYWNLTGTGMLGSWAYGWGYVIGTKGITVVTAMTNLYPIILSLVSRHINYDI